MAALTYTVLLKGKSVVEDPFTTTSVSNQQQNNEFLTQTEDQSPAGGETKLVSDDAPVSLLTASLRESPPKSNVSIREHCYC